MDKITVFNIRCSNYVGGPETTLFGWLKYINRERFDPHVVFFEERAGYHLRSLEVFADNNVPVKMIPWGYSRNLPGALKKLSAMIRKTPNCLLHTHDVRSDAVGLIVGRMTNTPVVVSNHAWHAIGFKRWLFETLRGLWLPHADMVINVSEDTHLETMRRGTPAERSRTIYSGLDLAPYHAPPDRSAAKKKLNLNPSDTIIGNVARMWPEKAQNVLIDAAVQIVSNHPDVRFVLVGDGLLENDLKSQVKSLGLESNVIFLGFRKDLVDVMAAFDIFALPSLAEGTPMVIYSAMALGLPIVASAASGVAEILEHEKTGLLIKPANLAELTAGIEYFLSHPDEGHKLGGAAKKAMEEKFSAEQSIKQIEKTYIDVMATRQ